MKTPKSASILTTPEPIKPEETGVEAEPEIDPSDALKFAVVKPEIFPGITE